MSLRKPPRRVWVTRAYFDQLEDVELDLEAEGLLHFQVDREDELVQRAVEEDVRAVPSNHLFQVPE